MKLKLVLATMAVMLVAAGFAGVKLLQFRKLMAAGRSSTQPPETVSSAVARQERWQNTLEAVASITAAQGVNITTELAGIVREITFDSGALVRQGDVLVKLDTSVEEAQLRALEAQADLAQIEAVRRRQLRAERTISEADLDSAEAALKQSQANAEAMRATIAKKTVRAAFAGRLGLRMVNLGEYVETGKTIVSLQALTPVYADFSLPQQELARLQTGLRVRLSTDTYLDREFEGTLMAISPELDAGTRTLRLRATFENAEQLLRPGMFARVEVLLPSEQPVLVIPATAVLSLPYGESVYVIEPEGDTNRTDGRLVVRQQFVRTGRARGDLVAVENGLKPGERVVSAGVFKLRPHTPVIENNRLAPAASPTPRPNEG